jgi:hypothetical protein
MAKWTSEQIKDGAGRGSDNTAELNSTTRAHQSRYCPFSDVKCPGSAAELRLAAATCDGVPTRSSSADNKQS